MTENRNGWAFVPSLYLFQGIPSCIVMQTSALLFADMGVEMSSFAFWTSVVCLPWTLKPFFSPFVERHGTKRTWVVWTELLLGLVFLALAATLLSDAFYAPALVLMGAVALASSFHDIACDGYYMLALSERQQSFFVGIRSTFFRISTVMATGLVPIVAGYVAETSGRASGWAMAIAAAGAVLLVLYVVNAFAMPRIVESRGRQDNSLKIFARALRSFFSHEGVFAAVAFFLFYRLGEAMLVKVLTPFLIAAPDAGGLGMSVGQCGQVYGTFGVVSLVVGGILGGWLAAGRGLRRVIWPMALAMNIPNLAYVALAHYLPAADSLWVYAAVMTEQFGYGFGFSAYMLYMLHYVGNAEYKAAEYSIGTSLMTLGILVPGMPAGALCNALGYEKFFLLAFLLTIPAMFIISRLHWHKSDA